MSKLHDESLKSNLIKKNKPFVTTEILYLHDRSILKGKIIKQTKDKIHFETPQGIVILSSDDIERIEYK